MTRSEFTNMLSYLSTHQTDARRLAAALEPFFSNLVRESEGNAQPAVNHISKSASETPGEEHATTTDGTVWMKAKDVAKVFGYGARWVIDRRDLLPPEYVKRAKSGKGKPAWLFHPNCIGLLNQYI